MGYIIIAKPPLSKDNSLEEMKIDPKKFNPEKAKETIEFAEKDAQEGRVRSMEILLRCARFEGADVKTLREIRQRGYERALKGELQCAMKYAEKGLSSGVDIALDFAEEYAARLEHNIEPRKREILAELEVTTRLQ